MSRVLGDNGAFVKVPLTAGMLSQSGLTTFNAAACVDGITNDGGYATGAQTSTTLKDTTKTWQVNVWTGGCTVKITSGLGSGQIRTISSNTVDTLTISSAWTTTPNETSVYFISGLPGWSTSSASVGAWLQIDLGASPACVQLVRISSSSNLPRNGNGTPSLTCKYAFEYSDNASSWTVVGSLLQTSTLGNLHATGVSTNDDWYLTDEWSPVTLHSSGSGDGAVHRYWRLRLTAITGGGVPFDEIELWTYQ